MNTLKGLNCFLRSFHLYNCKFKERTNNNYSPSYSVGSCPLALVIAFPGRNYAWYSDSTGLVFNETEVDVIQFKNKKFHLQCQNVISLSNWSYPSKGLQQYLFKNTTSNYLQLSPSLWISWYMHQPTYTNWKLFESAP